jgi:GntR family transcriptional repressor for pyruvate dehydrogenase complex
MKKRYEHAWAAVLDAVEEDLLAGRLKPGDHLPPERALATQVGVRPSAVREALRVLEVLGLVRMTAGADSSVGAIIVASPAGGMGSLMRLQVAAQGIQVDDVVRTRLLLETSVVRELSENSETADLKTVIQLLDAMENRDLSREEFLALDAQFHLALAEAADNQVVRAVMAGLRKSIEGFALKGAPGLVGWANVVDGLRSQHRGIAMAVIAGDGELAAERVHEHISNYYAASHLVEGSPYRR